MPSEQELLFHAVVHNEIQRVEQLLFSTPNIYERIKGTEFDMEEDEGNARDEDMDVDECVEEMTEADKQAASSHSVKRKGDFEIPRTAEALHLASLYGHTDMVRFLLSKGVDVNSKNKFHCSPLHIAASKGHLECAKVLIDSGATMNCSGQPQIVVSEQRAEINQYDKTEHVLLSPDRLEIMNDTRSFQSARCNIGVSHGKWYYEVEVITSGLFQIGWATKDCEFLPQSEEGVGDTLYSYAFDGSRCCKWHKEVSVPYGECWKSGDIIGCFLDLDNGTMAFSINGKHFGIAYDNIKDSFKGPLYPALSMDKFQWCRFNFGADPLRFPPNSMEGYQPIQNAASTSCFSAFATKHHSELVVNQGDITMTSSSVQQMQLTMPLTAISPLHWACYNGHFEMAQLLLARGADPNSDCGIDGKTPLMEAAFRGNLACLTLLLKYNAQVNLQDKKGRTALHYTAYQGHMECTALLMAHSADPIIGDSEGRLMTHYACCYSHTSIIKYLQQQGVDISLPDRKGWPPLMFAACNGNYESCAYLIKECGQPVNCSTSEGRTPLHLASQIGSLSCLKLFLEHKGDVNIADLFGSTPIASAAFNNFVDCVLLLIEKGANVNHKNAYGKTALHKAGMRGGTNSLQVLLDNGADLESRDQKGATALHEASSSGSVASVLFLLSRGMDVNCGDSKGSTPLHYAICYGRSEVARSLIEHGAILDFSDVWYRPNVKGVSPPPRYGHTVSQIGNKVYLFGGYCSQRISDELYVLNLDTMNWTLQESNTSSQLASPLERTDHTCTPMGDKLFIFGGKVQNNITNQLLIYDTVSKSWNLPVLAGDVPGARIGHSATAIDDNHIVIVGGLNPQNTVLDDSYVLNIRTMEWKLLPTNASQLPGGKITICFHGAALINGEILTFGGNNSAGEYNGNYALDLETCKWRVLETLNNPAGRSSCTVISHGQTVYLLGGIGRITEEHVLEDFHSLDFTGIPKNSPIVPKWKSICTQLGPVQRFDTTAFFHQNKLYTFGGCDNKYLYGDMHALHVGTQQQQLLNDHDDDFSLFVQFKKMMDKQSFADFVIHCEGRAHPCHKVVLYNRSQVFRQLLDNEWQGLREVTLSPLIPDLNKDTPHHMTLPMTSQALSAVLSVIYTDEIGPHPPMYDELQSRTLAMAMQRLAPNLMPNMIQSATRMHYHREESTLSRDMKNAFLHNQFKDAVFEVEGKVVLAHKSIICCRCDYFRGLLAGGLRESQQSKVVLRDISYDTFMTIMEYIYTDRLNLTHETNIHELITFSKLYLLDGLRKQFEEQVIKSELSRESVTDILAFAQQYELDILVKGCQTFIAQEGVL